MMQLLLETATEVCSVAVAHHDRILAEVTASAPQQHASHLTLLIQEVLEQADCPITELEEVVLSDGPGSYTSLRVGAATVKGLCLALPGLQLSVVPTLAALAWAAPTDGVDRILATVNSRRGEVYGQVFAADTRARESEVMNVRLKDSQWRGKLLNGRGLGKIRVCGPGQDRIREVLDGDNAFSFAAPLAPAARFLLAPARRRPAVAAYEPLYLNPPFVTQSKKKSLL
ncbi:tRNA threonylcarbamoyladenosine biosynthesis protein TsaB [Lewinella marina]|uniref:tRNA (Adenosine(37)-N6)-threonylcarbamoyltransferase complex dimerization subunit type 1 TsaB n=1 Tax=Neolewinella marina TaxID=438751 RepID=A0A2G0CH56_9BACT|nr:tRNA (adenosine(37)-N6)-threonylcarbamoyltransferase complex dimerization subunit type 1 TsaB [Neolewinella marina]NJB86267.1 tRNA threonylcarbamoyladenosine biosynthesis protein TsaB [Neolewinella marina]PHK99260.1 tRNA (adenosine(37)-N6)-threonylcarbamoyltransferase complex dimerization subunit type 1 TsaB [Neolewinella marina]